MGILDGIVAWIAEQVMHGLDLINTSVLGALGCDMSVFLRYFPAAETMYEVFVALAIGLILLGFGVLQLGLSLKSHDPSQRANGMLTIAGGIVITFTKEILTLITG